MKPESSNLYVSGQQGSDACEKGQQWQVRLLVECVSCSPKVRYI